VTGYGVMKIIL